MDITHDNVCSPMLSCSIRIYYQQGVLFLVCTQFAFCPLFLSINQDTVRCWERSAGEQTFMCYQAAGLNRCLTKVQDSMVAQLKTLHLDNGKGKASGPSQQAVDELEYLVTFNRSITQAMARMMQNLSEGVFVNMANLTLARRDSYLDYLKAGVKQDTLTALRNSPLHIQSLFLNQLLIKAEEEVSPSEERHTSSSHKICMTYMLFLLLGLLTNQTGKVGARPLPTHRSRLKV